MNKLYIYHKITSMVPKGYLPSSTPPASPTALELSMATQNKRSTIRHQSVSGSVRSSLSEFSIKHLMFTSVNHAQ